VLAEPLLSAEQCRDMLRSGHRFRTGPFSYHLKSDVPAVLDGFARFYAGRPQPDAAAFVDFEVEVLQTGGWRRWLRPQAHFRFDGVRSFEPLPANQGFALLEWALNWCITAQVNHWLLIHAAVLERDGRALILPAPPGSGKSTLCAALALRGWRLLSDEIAIISLDAERLHALARPVSLKNQSIQIIADFEPSARFSRPALGTAKGTVAQLAPVAEHVRRVDETAAPAWVVFPRWQPGSKAEMKPRPKATTVLDLAKNSFNFPTLGTTGFDTMTRLVDRCACHDFSYEKLDDAIAAFEQLART
jgi:hypothetical protein